MDLTAEFFLALARSCKEPEANEVWWIEIIIINNHILHVLEVFHNFKNVLQEHSFFLKKQMKLAWLGLLGKF